MFVKPAPGRIVRDPVKGTLLPESGAQVPDTIFWCRRLRDGDIEICTPDKGVKPATVKKHQEQERHR